MNPISIRAKVTEAKNGRLVLIPVVPTGQPADMLTKVFTGEAARIEIAALHANTLTDFPVGAEYTLTIERSK